MGCMKSALGGQGWWVCWHRSHETEVQSGVLPRVDEWEERITQVYRNTYDDRKRIRQKHHFRRDDCG